MDVATEEKDAAGFKRLVILKGHVTNWAPLRCALENVRTDFPRVRIALRSIWEISRDGGTNFHANAAETSLMLHLRPELVDMTKAKNEPDRSACCFFSYTVEKESVHSVCGSACAGAGRKQHVRLHLGSGIGLLRQQQPDEHGAHSARRRTRGTSRRRQRLQPLSGRALTLAAGLEGIKQGIDPGEPHLDNMYLKSDAELDALGVKRLPKTLEEAVDAFEADPLSEQVFGKKMRDAWISFKRDEWLSYLNHVSDWERARYLKFY